MRRAYDVPDRRTVEDLIDVAIADLEALRTEHRWKVRMAYGKEAKDGPGPVSGGGPSDPTAIDAAGRQHLRRRITKARADLAWLVDRKLPGIARRYEIPEDDPRTSDDTGGASIDGGLSAYRTQDNRIPAGRPDLADAKDAQARRIARGDGWGDG